MNFERLTKTVRVSDPDCWYEKDTVKVHLFVTSPYKGVCKQKVKTQMKKNSQRAAE